MTSTPSIFSRKRAFNSRENSSSVSALRGHRTDGRQLHRALGRDLAIQKLAAEAGSAAHRVAQVFELRVDLDRRDRDRRNLVVSLVELVELVAQLRNRAMGSTDLAEQRQRDRAVGQHDQVASQVSVGCRFDDHLIADVDLVGAGNLVARDAKHELQLVVDAQPIGRHVRQAGATDVLTLRILLKIGRWPQRLSSLAAVHSQSLLTQSIAGVSQGEAGVRC